MNRALCCLFTLGSIVILTPGFLPAQTELTASSDKTPLIELSDQILRQRIELFILENYRENHDEIVLEFGELPEPITVDPLDWEVKVAAKYGKVKTGTNRLEVTVFSKSRIIKQFVTTTRLKTFDDVVVAASRLNKGERFSKESLVIKRIESTNLHRKCFTMIKELVDLQTKKIVLEGKPIFVEMVELPDIIHRGDVVRLVVTVKNLRVTASARALQNGRRGEQIMIENLSTGKRLSGVIENEKTVVVEL